MYLIQQGSKYRTSLVFKWSQKEVGCQMVCFSNANLIPNSPTILIPDKWTPSCFLCTGAVFEWLVHYIGHNPQTDQLNTEPFEIRTPKSSVFKCFRYSNGRYSDLLCSYNSSHLLVKIQWGSEILPFKNQKHKKIMFQPSSF